jgi:hypothetical protein
MKIDMRRGMREPDDGPWELAFLGTGTAKIIICKSLEDETFSLASQEVNLAPFVSIFPCPAKPY